MATNFLREVHASIRGQSFQHPVDFSGAVARGEFHGQDEPLAYSYRVPDEFDLVAHGEEIFEWLDIAHVILHARRPLVFVELGSGYGRWSARFWKLAHHVQAIDTKLVMVEAEPTHVRWARVNMADNAVPRESWRLLEAAVSSVSGSALFYNRMKSAEGEPRLGEWYGQSLVSAAHPESQESPGFRVFLRKKIRLLQGWNAIKVKTLGVKDVLRGIDRVSLMDFDIQNSEGQVVRGGIGTLNQKVERVHIGTHSESAERELRDIFSNNNWVCVRDFPCNSSGSIEPWGTVSFQDGVQTWINSSLVDPNASRS